MRLAGFAMMSVMVLFACSAEGGGQDASQPTQSMMGQAQHFRFSLTPGASVHQGTNEFRLHLEETSGAPVTGAQLQFNITMPAHNHVSSAPVDVSDLGSGNYNLRDVTFTMEGQWDVVIGATKSGQQDSATFVFDVP